LLRFKQFKANYLRIVKVNNRNLTYRVGLGPFTHLSKAGFSGYADFCHHSFDRKKGEEQEESEFFSGFSNAAGQSMPDSIDWVSLGKVTPPKSQAKCGSCWAYATVAAVESRRAIASGVLQNMSEKELIDCVEPKDGSLIEHGFSHVIKSGLQTSEEYSGTCSSGGANQPILKGFVRTYVEDEESLRFAVSSGPVAVGIQGDQWDMQHYHDGVMSGSFCNTALNHAALLVGYGTGEGLQYWKLKNSWGTIWGEGGYFRLIRNSDRNDEYGQCGITLRASYPVV
jgi:KDEL-tailed cysteine endopeptidase